MNQQEIENQVNNSEPQTDDPKPVNGRVFFQGNREGDWEKDARDLMQNVFYGFDSDEPEPLVKLFAVLEDLAAEPQIKDALRLLMGACFDRSSVRSEFLSGYIQTCLAHPGKWDRADDNPERVTAEKQAAGTGAPDGGQRQAATREAEGHIETFVSGLSGLLKNVILPKEIRDQLTDAADAIINHEGIDTESHIEAHLTDALKRISVREREKESGE